MNEDKIEFDNPNFIPSNKAVFPLKYCTFEVWPEINFVETKFPDDFSCGAIRELNEDNLREVTCQGYIGEMPIWKSLVEHEYLHSLISELLYDRPSLVLETESGRKFHPSWLRYQEESIVIAMQFLVNSTSDFLDVSCTRDMTDLESDSLLLIFNNTPARNLPTWRVD